jgi:hypothetical protein
MIRHECSIVKLRGRYKIGILSLMLCLIHQSLLMAQYSQLPHRTIKSGEIAVDKPGYYGKSGATYVFTQNITSDRSGIFLGKDVTLDLNGYTLTFAEGSYTHLPNSGFEEGEEGWDLTKAPGAEVVNTKDVHIFMGDKLLSLKKGDEVVSEYLYLPVDKRSYYAMSGITGHHYSDMNGDLANEMRISVYVEDEEGKNVEVMTQYGDSTLTSSPVLNKSPRLGGGFIFAHLNNLPAGKYRIRVKAETDCLIDEVDFRPAMDVGIGIVGKTHPMGHYDHLYEIRHSAFFDYTEDPLTGRPLPEIPVVQGRGSVTIKNGIIRSGSKGVMSWGIQSTAEEVKVVLDNVKVINQGINAIAVDVPHASITNCTFDVDNPFLINRHGSQFYAVDLRGSEPSEVSYSEFYGGQGCLVYKGNRSTVHHNSFFNRQMVTNHYSIMAMGDSSTIYENKIEPESGSGIEIFRNKGIEIFNNTIKIQASPPTCEYGSEEYSVAAIRIADYHALPGSEGAAADNKVYNNTIDVKGMVFPEFPQYTPMAWGIFYSASGGENEIFGNRIFVNHEDPGSKSDAAAFYICGGVQGFGGSFYNNLITTNVPAAWIASRYGGTANTNISYNKIVNSMPERDFPPFRVGFESCKSCYAKEVVFNSNELEGMDFGFDFTDQEHSFKVYHTLDVQINDAAGEAVDDMKLAILNTQGQIVAEGKSNTHGKWSIELLDHTFNNGSKTSASPYYIQYGASKKEVVLDRNKTLQLSINAD